MLRTVGALTAIGLAPSSVSGRGRRPSACLIRQRPAELLMVQRDYDNSDSGLKDIKQRQDSSSEAWISIAGWPPAYATWPRRKRQPRWSMTVHVRQRHLGRVMKFDVRSDTSCPLGATTQDQAGPHQPGSPVWQQGLHPTTTSNDWVMRFR